MGNAEQQSSWWDVRNWDEGAYRASLQRQKQASTRTVFAARLAPSSHLLATASSDGSVCLFSIASCLSSQPAASRFRETPQAMEPYVSLSKHDGAAYDLQFYGEGNDTILLSCGDDGKIQGWHWEHVKDGAYFESDDGKPWKPDFVLINPQQKGSRGALAPMPETNAMATNSKVSFFSKVTFAREFELVFDLRLLVKDLTTEFGYERLDVRHLKEGHIFSATGNGHAYCWDIEMEKIVTTFEGHSEYLHCICARPSHKQVITGSEDGTVRIWDCRSASTVAILDACKAIRVSKAPKEKLPWVSCAALDSSEKWLVCGTGGKCLTLWSLLSLDAVTRISTSSAPQAVTIANNQIMSVGALPCLSCFTYGGDVISQVGIAPSSAFSISAYSSGVCVVAGYGGLVDIISEFGSHISTFRCK